MKKTYIYKLYLQKRDGSTNQHGDRIWECELSVKLGQFEKLIPVLTCNLIKDKENWSMSLQEVCIAKGTHQDILHMIKMKHKMIGKWLVLAQRGHTFLIKKEFWAWDGRTVYTEESIQTILEMSMNEYLFSPWQIEILTDCN